MLETTDVIQAIEHDPNCDRIKKLMAFASSRMWKGQKQALNDLDLGHLIAELMLRYPSPEELQTQLYYLASTLNKTAEYTVVANAILSYLAPIYAQQQPSAIETQGLDYASVTLQLQHDPDALRIKKLLICACGNPWQNDVAALNSTDMGQLVSQLRQIAPTHIALVTMLNSVVATLNRAEVYALIANRVAIAFTSLYDAASQVPSAAIEQEVTEFMEPPCPSAPPLTDMTVQPPVLQPLGGSLPSNTPTPASRPLTLSKLAKSLPRVQLSMVDLYDLRLEIIKYTCPLRAKVLLFSALRQHTDWSGHDYSMLKTTDLSALLAEMFQTYKHLDHVRPVLSDTATKLQPASDYLQACGAILRAISPWYDPTNLDKTPIRSDDHTIADPSTFSQVEQTDMQFSQGEVTGMITAKHTEYQGQPGDVL